ncbi:MAG: MFS transporter [Chitinophagaceae bacterium]
MKKYATIWLLALGHGLNDLVAGYFLGCLVQLKIDLLQVGLGLLVYNLLAFGGQYPVALWLEKYKDPKRFLIGSYILNTLAVSFFFFAPHLSIVLAGIASAIYHVAGGTVCARDHKALPIGLFAAPGVAGLVTGGYFAYAHYSITGALLAATVCFLLLLVFLPVKKRTGKDSEERETKFTLDQHDLVMILLLTVISLRSVIWNIFQLVHENNYQWLIAIAVAAFAGKILGGWLADRIGWRLYIFISLATAAPLITLFKEELVLFCIGIGLLQSGIPATTALVIRSVRGKTERGIGLSFGTAIIAGALSLFIPGRSFLFSNAFIFISTFVMLLLLVLAGKKGQELSSGQ